MRWDLSADSIVQVTLETAAKIPARQSIESNIGPALLNRLACSWNILYVEKNQILGYFWESLHEFITLE